MRRPANVRFWVAVIHRDFNTDGYIFDYDDSKRMYVSRGRVEDAETEFMTKNIYEIGYHLRVESERIKFGRSWYRLWEKELGRLCPAS